MNVIEMVSDLNLKYFETCPQCDRTLPASGFPRGYPDWDGKELRCWFCVRADEKVNKNAKNRC